MPVICYPITHAGEGERGKPVYIQAIGKSAEDCAEDAAWVLDDCDMQEQGADDASVGAWHGGSHIIEVVGHPWHPEPMRFRVRCKVVRQYDAERI